jgi:S-adenosylmethionine:tRNA ribosyltransferase-isomerase
VLTRGARTSDYDFHLPPDRVAQSPAATRDASRLMVLHRNSGAIEHRTFADIATLIQPADALVRNTTKVFRARLLGTRESGAPAEILLLRRIDAERFEAMVHPGGKLKPGRVVDISPQLQVQILEVTDRRTRIVRLLTALSDSEAIERFGHVPLPPYIARPDSPADAERYQTVYANESGSVAAPTAGLHFTPELLDRIQQSGARVLDVVLHVGAGTFKPVETEDPAEHMMHEEWYELPPETADAIAETRTSGGNVWAVGTTTVRTLESAARDDGALVPGARETNIFIRPPYAFRAVDRLITNFHLPRSTLLMLVAAFAGYDLTMHAYDVAVREGYRFYSYGDAMVIL